MNKVAQPPIPHNPTTASHQLYSSSQSDEDVHMATMRGTVDPKMLKRYHASGLERVQEDVHMKTVAREVPKERMLQPWERELLDKPDTKRKATVAQIYFLDYYCELPLVRFFLSSAISSSCSRPSWLSLCQEEASRDFQDGHDRAQCTFQPA